MPGQHPDELASLEQLTRLQGVVAELEEDRKRTGVLVRQLQGTDSGTGPQGPPGPPGPIGPPGPPGTGTGAQDKNYVHTQSAPSASWTVTHNLDKYVAVDVVDSGESVVIPSVTYLSVNSVRLDFGSATSGKAFVN